MVRELLNPTVYHSGSDHCLRRHGLGPHRDRKAKDDTLKHSGLKAFEPGYIHIDVKYPPHMANETWRGYFFMTIDRVSRRVFVAMYHHKTAANARYFLDDLERKCPIRIRTILTGNGKASTDRLFGVRRRAATRQHAVDMLCSTSGIEHWLAPPRSPQTNGMVERFNGRIKGITIWIRRRAGDDVAPQCLALQPPACTIRLRQKNALASHEAMAQTHTGIV